MSYPPNHKNEDGVYIGIFQKSDIVIAKSFAYDLPPALGKITHCFGWVDMGYMYQVHFLDDRFQIKSGCFGNFHEFELEHFIN